MTDSAPRAFVCGHPISHSRSPLIHGHWLKVHGLAGSYEALDVPPARIAGFLEGLPGSPFVGGNVTIPHKEAAFAACAEIDDDARQIGAVNTVWIEHGRLCGSNTDAYGFAANLDSAEPSWRSGRNAVVIGAGGASRAVVHAILEAGYGSVHVVNRSAGRVADLARHFGDRVSAHAASEAGALLARADLLVNTTSLGMHGEAELPADVGLLPAGAIVTDIVYVPLVTPLLAAAAARGLRTVDGLGMLLHQARPGFERWFGVGPAVTPELRDLVIRDMEAAS